jgi:hypothetical protein
VEIINHFKSMPNEPVGLGSNKPKIMEQLEAFEKMAQKV